MNDLQIGVLALQGAFARHRGCLERIGCEVIEVRTAEQLASVDALVLPGGESTTMTNLLHRSGLWHPLHQRLVGGMPTFATCAGLILLASQVKDGRSDQVPLGSLDVAVRRNGYGRQIASFEADIDIAGVAQPVRAVFIRAPVIERVGDGVDVLAEYQDQAVLVAQDSVLAATFHPELTDDDRLHRLWLDRFVTPVPPTATGRKGRHDRQ